MPTGTWPRNTEPAIAANMTKAAIRAVDDPDELARAARIVRAALQRRRLRLADLDGEIVQPSDLKRPAGDDDRGAAA